MTRTTLSALTAAFVVAMTGIGFAAAVQSPTVQIRDITPVRTVDAAAREDPRRIYCYNGVKGDQVNLYRGWTCVPDHHPL